MPASHIAHLTSPIPHLTSYIPYLAYRISHLASPSPIAVSPPERYNDLMSQRVGSARSALAAAWCLLVAAGDWLAQFSAVNGSPVTMSDPVQAQLRTVYLGFLALFAALGLYQLWHWRQQRRAAGFPRLPSERAPGSRD